jgi:hypothetical protein
VDRKTANFLGGNIDGVAAGYDIAAGQFVNLRDGASQPIFGESFAVESFDLGPIFGVDNAQTGQADICSNGVCVPATTFFENLTPPVVLPGTPTGVRAIINEGATVRWVFEGSFIEVKTPNHWAVTNPPSSGTANGRGVYRLLSSNGNANFQFEAFVALSGAFGGKVEHHSPDGQLLKSALSFVRITSGVVEIEGTGAFNGNGGPPKAVRFRLVAVDAARTSDPSDTDGFGIEIRDAATSAVLHTSVSTTIFGGPGIVSTN